MNADFSHTCEGCEHVVTEPWAKDITLSAISIFINAKRRRQNGRGKKKD